MSPTSQRWAWLSGAISGFTSTFAHAGGPPLAICLLGRGLPRETCVAKTVFVFVVINRVKVPFHAGLGLFARDTLLTSLVLLPLVPVGVWLGPRLLTRIPERLFHVFASTMLDVTGLSLLWGSLTG